MTRRRNTLTPEQEDEETALRAKKEKERRDELRLKSFANSGVVERLDELGVDIVDLFDCLKEMGL